MSLYSEYLLDYIHKKDIKVASLTDFCQIDRSTMYKIINGKRNPSSKDLVNKIASFIKLDPTETKEYYHAYYNTLIGKDRYEHYKEIESFLLTFEISKNASQDTLSTSDEQNNTDIITIKGTNFLNYYIQQLLEEETKQDNPHVYYIG